MGYYIDRYGEEQVLRPLRDFWRIYQTNSTALFGLMLLALIILMLLMSPILTPYGPDQQFVARALTPPSWAEGGSNQFLLGTDELGRDIFSRILLGGRLTLSVAFVTVLVAAVIGTALGLISTYIGGWLDRILSGLTELVLTFPSLILALLIVALTGPGLFKAALAVAAAMIPFFFKVCRNALHQQIDQPYYRSAQLDGCPASVLMFRVLFPNIASTVIIQTSASLSSAVVEIATLGFLGFGAQAPLAEWGTMIGDARAYSFQAAWLVWLPGLAMLLTLISINLVGDGIRESFEREHYQ